MKKRAYDFKKESRIFALVMMIILILIMAAGVMEVCGMFEDKEENVWKPSVSYPMANANINWMQTHHPGPWDGDPNGY